MTSFDYIVHIFLASFQGDNINRIALTGVLHKRCVSFLNRISITENICTPIAL